MARQENETDEILEASYRLELFIRKVEKQIQTVLIYKSSADLKKDVALLYDFLKKQKQAVEDIRKLILTGEQPLDKDYLNTRLSATPLLNRTKICLKNANITTVRELMDFKNKYGINGFNRLRNFGQMSFDEVVTFINVVESL